MLKFFETNCLLNKDFLNNSRTNLDLFLLYQTCKYFRPKKILEIGFNEGRSLSAMIQSCDPDSDFVTIDIDFGKSTNFKKMHETDLHRVQFVETDSKKYSYQDNFDLALVDGCHTYEYAYADIYNSSQILQNGIMIVDDYLSTFPGVIKAVNQFLSENPDWSPFMKGDSAIWLHKKEHDANFFLDEFIQKSADNFISFYNVQMLDYTVMMPTICKAFNEHGQLMHMACKLYDL